MTRLIVALCGYLDSGKTTAARRLRDRHGFAAISPADPIKRLGVELGFSEHAMFGPSSSRSERHPTLARHDGEPLSAREFCDVVSASVRGLSPAILLDASMRGDAVDLVNESCRKKIEYDAIRAAGGKLIKRKGGTRRGDEYDEVADMPDSAFDAVIPEGLTLEQLYGVLDALVDGWKSEAGR